MDVMLWVLLLIAVANGVNIDNIETDSSKEVNAFDGLEINHVFKVENRNKRDTQHEGNTDQSGVDVTSSHGEGVSRQGHGVSSHDNETGSHDDASGHHGNDSHHGIHVASWNFHEIQTPFFIGLFLFVSAICKLGK